MADELGSVSSESAQCRVRVASPVGLHARPAALFVRAVMEAGLAITISRPDGEIADARSILAVVMLDVRHGDEVLIRAEGVGAKVAVDRLGELLAHG